MRGCALRIARGFKSLKSRDEFNGVFVKKEEKYRIRGKFSQYGKLMHEICGVTNGNQLKF